METTDAMPYEPSTQCAQCGCAVDPVRAPCVLMLEHGPRFFCGVACRDGYRSADPSHRLRAARPKPSEARRDEPAQLLQTERPTSMLPPAPSPAATLTPAWLAVPAVSVVLALLDHPAALPGAALCATLGALGLAAVSRSARRELGEIAFYGAPLGAVLLALSGALGHEPLDVVTAGAVAALLWLREALTRREELRLGGTLDELAREVPERTRISLISPEAVDEAPETRPSLTAQVRAGDLVLVESGQIVPVDGVVSEGVAQVMPYPGARGSRPRGPGDSVLAGARVLEGSLRIAATRVGAARALFRPRALGLDTSSPAAARVSRVVGRLTGVSFALPYALVAGLLATWFAGSAREAVTAFAATLAAFPGLSLLRSVRVPFVAAAAKAARRGVVFRDASSLERAGRVATAVLCAEGSTTLGSPVLIELTPIGAPHDARELLGLALGAELAAPVHPLSLALQQYARERAVEPAVVRRASYAQSRGVTGLVDGAGALALGNRQLLLSTGVSVAVADREAQRAETQGRTVLFLAVGGRVKALLVFEDPTRPEARSAVQGLHDLDIDVVLLSGDHRASIEAIARALDITHVKAELGTQERGAEVLRLRDAGGLVAVVGRAGLDDSTLGAADVSITLDAAGGPREGDLAVASDDLRDAVEGLRIAHRARRTVQLVLAGSAGVAVLIGVSAALSVLPPLGAVLAAMALDAWALPSTARLVPPKRRASGAARSHGGAGSAARTGA